MPKVTEEHRAERRRQIAAGARRAFAEHGYAGATVEVLEREIGLSRGAIFSYFPTKLDLFVALAQEDQHRILELWLEGGHEAVVRHIVEDDPEWLGVYLDASRMLRTDPELRDRWRSLNPDAQAAARAALHGAPGGGPDSQRPAARDGRAVPRRGVRRPRRAAGRPVRPAIDVDGTIELLRSALAPK